MNRTALIAALSAMALGILLLGLYLNRFRAQATGGAPVSLLMVTKDVPIGDTLTEAVLGVRKLPEGYIEDRHVRADDLSRVLGVRVSVDLKAAQTLLWTDLATAQRERVVLAGLVRKGLRAITIKAEQTSSMGGLLQPGDRVDVLLTKEKPDSNRKVTVPLLQNILVLAIGRNTGAGVEDERQRNNSAITLGLTIDEAALLAQAEEGGRLRLILRNTEDLEILEGVAETDDRDVLEAERRAKRQRVVPKTNQIEEIK